MQLKSNVALQVSKSNIIIFYSFYLPRVIQIPAEDYLVSILYDMLWVTQLDIYGRMIHIKRLFDVVRDIGT